MPVPQLLTAARAQLGHQSYLVLPTLCWLNSSERVPAFSLRRGRRPFRASDRGDRADPLSRAALRPLPFAHDRGTDVLQFPMGYPAAGNGFSRDLSRAVALVAATRSARATFASGAFPSPFSALQADAAVRRGEADQRRRVVVESDRARLPLLDATACRRCSAGGRTSRRNGSSIFPRRSCSSWKSRVRS